MPLQQISVTPLDWRKENNHREPKQDRKIQEQVFTTSNQNLPERCPSRASTISTSHDICRICHCEAEPDAPLIAPCYCSGSLRYVHQSCLQQWIKSSDIRCCELCKFTFIMQSKVKPFGEWESLDMSAIERRKLLCSVTFHAIALSCVVWSLYVLIEKTAEEVQRGKLEWPFWTKLIVVAIGFTGGFVFMYIQCKAYLHLCRRWKAFNRIIFVQNAPEKCALSDTPSLNTKPVLVLEEAQAVHTEVLSPTLRSPCFDENSEDICKSPSSINESSYEQSISFDKNSVLDVQNLGRFVYSPDSKRKSSDCGCEETSHLLQEYDSRTSTEVDDLSSETYKLRDDTEFPDKETTNENSPTFSTDYTITVPENFPSITIRLMPHNIDYCQNVPGRTRPWSAGPTSSWVSAERIENEQVSPISSQVPLIPNPAVKNHVV